MQHLAPGKVDLEFGVDPSRHTKAERANLFTPDDETVLVAFLRTYCDDGRFTLVGSYLEFIATLQLENERRGQEQPRLTAPAFRDFCLRARAYRRDGSPGFRRIPRHA